MDEAQLVEKILDWTWKECERRKIPSSPANMRAVMQPFIHELALPTLTVNEFSKFPILMKILVNDFPLTLTGNFRATRRERFQ